jgi:hypothetical protein
LRSGLRSRVWPRKIGPIRPSALLRMAPAVAEIGRVLPCFPLPGIRRTRPALRSTSSQRRATISEIRAPVPNATRGTSSVLGVRQQA